MISSPGRENDAGAIAGIHPTNAEVFDREGEARLGKREHHAVVVAEGGAVGQRPDGREERGRETEGLLDARLEANSHQLLQGDKNELIQIFLPYRLHHVDTHVFHIVQS